MARWNPAREINDHPREKTGLGSAEAEPPEIKLTRRLDESECDCAETPSHQNSRSPTACAIFFDDQRSRNLQQNIASKKQPRTQAENPLGETKVKRHGHVPISDIRAIKKSREVQE